MKRIKWNYNLSNSETKLIDKFVHLYQCFEVCKSMKCQNIYSLHLILLNEIVKIIRKKNLGIKIIKLKERKK